VGFAEGEGFIAGAVIGHDPLDFNAEAFVVGERALSKAMALRFFSLGITLAKATRE